MKISFILFSFFFLSLNKSFAQKTIGVSYVNIDFTEKAYNDSFSGSGVQINYGFLESNLNSNILYTPKLNLEISSFDNGDVVRGIDRVVFKLDNDFNYIIDFQNYIVMPFLNIGLGVGNDYIGSVSNRKFNDDFSQFYYGLGIKINISEYILSLDYNTARSDYKFNTDSIFVDGINPRSTSKENTIRLSVMYKY